MARKIKKALLGLLLCVVVGFTPLTVEASDYGIGSVEEFDDLSGDAKYLGSQYRNNYYIDIEETGVMDSGYEMLNNIVNAIFGAIRLLVYFTCVIFYHSMAFDLGSLMSGFVNDIQQSLIDSVFWPLFMVGLAFLTITVIKKFIKRNMVGSLVEFVKVIILVVLTYFFARETGTVLTYTTQIAKEVSLQAMMEIGFSDSNVNMVQSYAAASAGGIWDKMLHEPWLIVEFGDSEPTAEWIEIFMNNEPGSADRKKHVKDYPGPTSSFAMTRGHMRLSFLLLYILPCILKCVILIAVSVIQLALQAVAVFYMLLIPLVLILAMFPDYGFTIFEWWWKKFLESQLGVLLITFVIGFIFRVEEVLYNAASQIGIGWMITMGFEIIIVAVVIKYHREILEVIPKVKDVKAGVDDYVERHRRYDDGYYEDDYDEEYSGGSGSHESRRMRRVSGYGDTRQRRSLSVYDSDKNYDKWEGGDVERPSLRNAPSFDGEMQPEGDYGYSAPDIGMERNIVMEDRDLSGNYGNDFEETIERPHMETSWDDTVPGEDDGYDDVYSLDDYVDDEVYEEEPAHEEIAEEPEVEPVRPRLRIENPETPEKDNVIETGSGRRIETDIKKRMGR